MPDRNEALKYINRADLNGYDPLREVLLLGASPTVASSPTEPQRTGSQPKTDANSATIVEDNNDSLRIDAKCDKPAMLVITDGFYPGWEAYDNGKRTEILLADGVLRAIPIQPGVHHIELYFLPKSMMCGTLISMFAIALSAGLLLTGLRRKRA